MQTVVISIGGSVLFKGSAYIKSLASLIEEVAKSRRIAITVGGGKIAREYISLARELGYDETTLDEFGIGVTRLNAKLFAHAIPQASPSVPETIETAYQFFRAGWIVVMGGTTPGHTTDAVAAMLAEKLRAERLVNVTNVDGLYDRDPRLYKDARKIERASYEELIRILSVSEQSAGQNNAFDLLGAKILKRAGIKLLIVSGENLEVLREAIEGKDAGGRWSEIG